MLKSGKSVVGLDIGSTAIKAVELTRNGKTLMVTGFGQLEVDGSDPQAVSQGIAELMKEGGFRSKRVVSSVSGQKVVIRYLSMAPMSEEELRNAIIFEAEKYIPFTLDECVMDCQRLEDAGAADPQGAGQNNVLLVAVTKDHVEEHLKTLGAAGVAPEVVDVDAFALSNAWDLVATSAKAKEGDAPADGVVAFVDIGASKTSVNIVHNGASVFTREIYVGGRDFTQAIARRMNVEENEAEALKRSPGENEENVREAVFPSIDDLGNELQLSFDYFETQYSKSLDKILLSGGGSRMGSVRDAFEKIFEKPVAVFNPFEGLELSQDLDQDLLAAGGPQLVVAAGLAARITKG